MIGNNNTFSYDPKNYTYELKNINNDSNNSPSTNSQSIYNSSTNHDSTPIGKDDKNNSEDTNIRKKTFRVCMCS